jgi:23S rRNA pseudouridine1911/1915/1917 synthase
MSDTDAHSRAARHDFTVDAARSGTRLDVYVAEMCPAVSRSQAQSAVRDGRVRVNGSHAKPSTPVNEGDRIELHIPEPVPITAEPQRIPVDVVYEDEWVVVVNKPPGLVVHPGCGNRDGTLVNALLYHCRNLSGIGGVIRPGIVHRIDKDTSGVLVAAKNDEAHRHLSRQFKKHTIKRKYLALVIGSLQADEGTIRTMIGRHRSDRKKMSVHAVKGREAVTHWRVKEVFDGFTLVELCLETGRTHQVRVHLSSAGCPVAGDRTYGGVRGLRAALPVRHHGILKSINRQMLHAALLAFVHPSSGKEMVFEAPPPDDFMSFLNVLRGE